MGLLVRGRMPVSREVPPPGRETPNIHPSTLADIEALFAGLGMAIEKRVLLDEEAAPMRWSRAANLRADAATYVLTSRRCRGSGRKCAELNRLRRETEVSRLGPAARMGGEVQRGR